MASTIVVAGCAGNVAKPGPAATGTHAPTTSTSGVEQSAPPTIVTTPTTSTSGVGESTAAHDTDVSAAEFYESAATEFKAMEDRLYFDPDLTWAEVPALCGESHPIAVEFGEAMAGYPWPAAVDAVAKELTTDVETIAFVLDTCSSYPGDPYSLIDTSAQLDFHFARFDDEDWRIREALGLPLATTTTTAPWVTKQAEPPDEDLLDSNPESMLITLSDMPAGWTEHSLDPIPRDQIAVLADCSGPNGDVLFDIDDNWSSTPQFVSPDGSVAVQERATLFESTEGAKAMMRSAWDAHLDTCYDDYLRVRVERMTNDPESPGASLPIGTSIDELDVSMLALLPEGYDAASHLITMELSEGSERVRLSFVLTFVQRGRALAFVTYSTTSGPEFFSVIGPLIDLAASKLPSD